MKKNIHTTNTKVAAGPNLEPAESTLILTSLSLWRSTIIPPYLFLPKIILDKTHERSLFSFYQHNFPVQIYDKKTVTASFFELIFSLSTQI